MAVKDARLRSDLTTQQRLARGEAAALGELYDRFASLVRGLAHRALEDEDAADAVTQDVFVHVWEHPESYDPHRGPLRSWLAELTGRLAVRRLRDSGSPDEARVRQAAVAARADYIAQSMPSPLSAAVRLAYFHRRDCRQVAADLGVTEAEAHRRLRLGLQLLSTAHDMDTPEADGSAGYGSSRAVDGDPPVEYGGASPGYGDTSPGQGSSPPEYDDSPPGHKSSPPGHRDSAPGHGGSAPGHRDSAPGHKDPAPGHGASP